MNIKCLEKRKVERFATLCPVVEVRDFSCGGQVYRGELIDCSETGVGLCMPYPVQKYTILNLRAGPDTSMNNWPADAGRFHMISIEVRWCQANVLADGCPRFRIGAVRLLPVF